MYLRVQLTEAKMSEWFSEEIRRQRLRLNTLTGLGTTNIYFDHLEMNGRGSFRVGPSEMIDFTPSGTEQTLQVNRPVLQFVQPIQIIAAGIDSIRQATNGVPSTYPLSLSVVFDIWMEVADGETRRTVTRIRLNMDATFGDIPSELTQALLGDLEGSIATPAIGVDLTGATAALGLTLAPVHAGIMLANGVIEMRVEVDAGSEPNAIDESRDIAGWRAFYAGSGLQNLLVGQDWGILVDSRLLVPFIDSTITDQLAGSDALTIETYPAVTYAPGPTPTFIAKYGIEIIDACTCAWSKIDVNVDISQQIALSVQDRDFMSTVFVNGLPQPTKLAGQGDIRQDWRFGFDIDNTEVFCCSITNMMLWPIIGAIMVGDDELSSGAYVGTTVAQILFAPLMFFGTIALASGQGLPNLNFGARCLKESDEHVICFSEPNLGNATGGACVAAPTRHMQLTRAFGHAQGPALVGSMTVNVAELPQIETELVEFFEATTPWNCSTPLDQVGRGFYLRGGLHVRSSNGHAFAVSFIRLIDDPEDAYHLWDWTFTYCPFSIFIPITVKKEVGYPCRIMISTSSGVRIVEFEQKRLSMSPQEMESYQREQQARQIQMCHIMVDPWYLEFHRLNPKWLVDPPPFMVDRIRRLWRYMVSGVMQGDRFALFDAGGRQVDVAVADQRGHATLGAFSSGQDLIGFQRLEARATSGGGRQPRPKLNITQTDLIEVSRVETASPIRSWTLSSHNGAPVALVATDRGVLRVSMADPLQPKIATLARPGGAMASVGPEIARWDGNTLSMIDATGAVRGRTFEQGGDIVSVAGEPHAIAVGFSGEVALLDRRLQDIQRLKTPNLLGLTGSGRELKAVTQAGVRSFRKAKTGWEDVSPKAQDGKMTAPTQLLASKRHIGDGLIGRFDGELRKFDPAAGSWAKLEAGEPWFIGMKRTGKLVVSQLGETTLRIETLGESLSF